MDKAQLIEKVGGITKENFDKPKLQAWVQSLEGSVNFSKPISYKKGDVLMHPVFLHPYVLLKKEKDYWVCVLLTSDDKCLEIMEKCDSRFFSESFFTRTFFTVTEPVGRFGNVFENTKQLNSIITKLKKIFG